MKQKITPFLSFKNEAEQAARFYVSVFKNSKIDAISRYDEEGAKVTGQKKGSVMMVEFRLGGQKFVALNGGPSGFNMAVSFVVSCENQKEVDYYWKKLSQGGKEVQCGWLTDKYGLAWQIVPAMLMKLVGGRDKTKARRAFKAMLGMTKFDIEKIQAAVRSGE